MIEQKSFWPKRRRDVCKFFKKEVKTYQESKKKKKPPTIHNIGLYTPLLVPIAHWENVSMDFVVGYLEVNGEGIPSLWWMANFQKMAHFLCCKLCLHLI